jgi:DNA-binding CsgD family transcriptional regulator
MTTGSNNHLLSSLVTSYFDEAVQIIHLHWETQNDFAAAIAEVLRALFTADTAYVGSTDVRTGIRQPIVSDLLAELDPTSASWFESTIERCSVAFEGALEEQSATVQPKITQGWKRGNPYTVLSRAFALGEKLGALIPLWDRATLIDFFVSFSGENQFVPMYRDLFNRLIPHLEIAVTRIWRRDQPPSLDSLLKRLRHVGMTAREVEVLWWLLQGKTNPEIAIIMGVSVQTVKNHLGSAYPKLGVENRGAAFVQLSTLMSDH